MTPAVRRLVFYAFLGAFFIVSPILVFYTAGFRYNFQSGTVIRTGVLSLSTTPRGADIMLNGLAINPKTPAVVEQLMPGKYDIVLTRENFRPWHGTVEVKSGESTRLSTIRLWRDDELVNVSTLDADFLAHSPLGDELVYSTAAHGWSEIWLLALPDGEPKMISRVKGDDFLRLEWSADGSYLLVAQGNGEPSVFAKSGESKTITDDILAASDRYFWHPTDGSSLYAAGQKNLYLLDLQNGQASTLTVPDADSVLIDASTLTFKYTNDYTELHQIENEQDRLVALLPRNAYTVELRRGPYVLLRDGADYLTLIDLHGDQPILLQSQSTLFDWQDERSELLLSNLHELNVYSPQNNSTELLTRLGEPIINIAWHLNGDNVLFTTEHDLFAIERDRLSQTRAVTNLQSMDNIETFWISKDGKTTYLYGTQQEVRGLYSLRLR